MTRRLILKNENNGELLGGREQRLIDVICEMPHGGGHLDDIYARYDERCRQENIPIPLQVTGSERNGLERLSSDSNTYRKGGWDKRGYPDVLENYRPGEGYWRIRRKIWKQINGGSETMAPIRPNRAQTQPPRQQAQTDPRAAPRPQQAQARPQAAPQRAQAPARVQAPVVPVQRPPLVRYAPPPPELLEIMTEDDIGGGLSSAQEDNLIPIIRTLQTNSPYCEENNPAWVEGAMPGNFIMLDTKEIIDGQDIGLEFQPCHWDKDWVEWIPRKKGTGLIARHRKLPDDAERVDDPDNPNRIVFMRPNGNEVIETRYHIGYVMNTADGIPAMYSFPLSSTGHRFSKAWMTIMNRHLYTEGPHRGEKYASWSRTYLIKSRYTTKNNNSWYINEIAQDIDWVSIEQYEMGRQLALMCRSGDKTSDIGQAGGDPEHEQTADAQSDNGGNGYDHDDDGT